MLLCLLAACAAVAVVASARAPQVRVIVDDVTVTAGGSATVVVGPSSATSTAPASAAAATSWRLPTWLGTPFARYTLYALASAGAVLLLQWLKRRFGWEGKKMLTATSIVVAVFGLGLTILTQDKAYLSNPFNIGGAIGLLYAFSNLAYQLWIKR